MYEPIIFEKPYDATDVTKRGILIEVNIADIHFGAPGVRPDIHYQILHEQFIMKIAQIHFDILIINGDLFDKRFPSTSDVIKYALMFVNECVNICRDKNATFIIINGTKSHDDGQLNLLYQYLQDPTVDVRIVESTQFLMVKGSKKLCIPEEYGKGKDYYDYFLHQCGRYDSVNLHGTVVGSVYGANKSDLDSKRAPVFALEDFNMCYGPIIAGHVHTGGCFNTYMYYCSSPIRYKFGEEEPKGFIILLHNLDSHEHYVHFEEITSFRYDTITVDTLVNSNFMDPNNITNYIDSLKMNGIDHIRIIFNNVPEETQLVVKQVYKTDGTVVFKEPDRKEEVSVNTTEEIEKKYEKLDFLMDPKMDEYEKFVRYINYNQGSDYITVDKLREILGGRW